MLTKDETGEGVRPIALGKALLKLAEAVAVDETSCQLRAYLEPAQVAVRTLGGAELVAHLIRTWTQEWPENALLQVDLWNAYGGALRISMLRSSTMHAPAVSHVMANQWGAENVAWARVGSEWRRVATCRGG